MNEKIPKSQDIKQLKDFIIACLDEKKAENITFINLGQGSPLAEYMIFASGRSVKNIGAMAEFVTFELKHKFGKTSHIEGLGGSGWVVIDALDIIVHIFHPEARESLKLEEKWQKSSTH